MELSHRYNYTDADRSVALAVKVQEGTDNTRPGFVWFGGYKSDMDGTKAQVMVEHGKNLGSSTLRFDYSGHGASQGDVVAGSISNWVAETLAVFRQFTTGPQIVLGSSMGSWIALRVVQELAKLDESNRICGLLLIAPAHDFTSELVEPRLSKEQKQQLETVGRIEEASRYSDQPNVITAQFLEDGAKNKVLGSDIIANAPVHILQGMQDPEVPYAHAMELVTQLPSDNVTITMVKDGDHRLSTNDNLELLKRTMEGFHPSQ